jgi:hypothetical protein
MADRNITQMPAATGITSTDLLYLYGGNISQKLTIGTMFSDIPVQVKALSFLESATPQALTAAGVVSLSTPVTKVSTSGTGYSVTMNDGQQNQEKTIVMSGGTNTVTITGNIVGGSVELRELGDAVLLKYIDSQWYILGGNNYLV